MRYRELLAYLAMVLLVSFPLHLAWEWFQCQPFFVHRATPPTAAAMLAATLGDLALTLMAFAAVSAVHGLRWPLERWRWLHLVTLEAVALMLAVAVELHALAAGRWSYTDAAPRLPFTGVSALPVMQLMLLLPVSFRLPRSLAFRRVWRR
jgi:hypothetical protein